MLIKCLKISQKENKIKLLFQKIQKMESVAVQKQEKRKLLDKFMKLFQILPIELAIASSKI